MVKVKVTVAVKVGGRWLEWGSIGWAARWARSKALVRGDARAVRE